MARTKRKRGGKKKPVPVGAPPENKNARKMNAAAPAVLASIRRGMSYRAAASAGNISYQTLRNWIRRAEKEIERVSVDYRRRVRKDELIYVEFYRQLQEALGQGELVNADSVHNAGNTVRIDKETRVTTVKAGDEVVKETTLVIERELPPDWRAAAFILERRYGWVPTRHKARDDFLENLDWDALTYEELDRISNGEDPLVVLASRPVPSNSGEEEAPASGHQEDE